MDINKKIIIWIVAILFLILIIIILIISSQKYYNDKKISELKHYEDSRTLPQQKEINNIENQTNENISNQTIFKYTFQKMNILNNKTDNIYSYLTIITTLFLLIIMKIPKIIIIPTTLFISLYLGTFIITLLLIPLGLIYFFREISDI